MSAFKHSKDIYDALCMTGVKVGDLLRYSNDSIGVVTHIGHVIFVANVGDAAYSPADTFIRDIWPTHFARPYWSGLFGFAFEAQSLHGEIPDETTAPIKYDTKPLTLEERVERLEKLQGVGK